MVSGRRHVLVSCVLLLGLGLETLIAATARQDATLAKEPCVDKQHGFSIRFPEGWRVKGSTVPETIIKARLPQKEAPITYMSVATYPAPESQEASQLSAEQLFQKYIVAGNEVDARIMRAGRMTVGGRAAVWMEIDIRSPPFVSQYALAYFFPGKDKILRVSGSTERNDSWFARMKPVFKASIESLNVVDAGDPEAMRLYTDSRHGFSVRYPHDWTKKETQTEATLLKVVRKFADGQFLMLTVNAQLLDRKDYTVADMSVVEIALLAKEALTLMGASKVEPLGFSRRDIDGRSCARMILEMHHPLLRAKVLHYTIVINGRYAYTITVGCDKPLYSEHAHLMKRVSNSFRFTSPLVPSNAQRQSALLRLEQDSYTSRLPSSASQSAIVIQEPGDSWWVALFKGTGSAFLKFFLIGAVFAAGGAIWAWIRSKRRREQPKNMEQDQR